MCDRLQSIDIGTVVVGVEQRGRGSRALPRWSQSLPHCVIRTQTQRLLQQTPNLRKIRGCKKIPGAKDQELRALEARRNRKNIVQRTYVSKQTDQQHQHQWWCGLFATR